MKGIKEAFIDAGEISQMLGIGMTKAYAIIKEYNAELEAKGYFTIYELRVSVSKYIKRRILNCPFLFRFDSYLLDMLIVRF